MLKVRHINDSKDEVGIDEAGRGCLWGPLIAAAVQWPDEINWTEEIRIISAQIKDSKKLSAKRRAVLEKAIKKHSIAWGIGCIEASEIDTMGMTKANRLAFCRAIDALGKRPERILVDGILPSHYEGVEEIVEPKGDATYLAIAAASIIAKESRDRIVKEICDADTSLNEKYDLSNSKGYGTLKHRNGIKEHGIHIQHRKLFLRKLLGLEHNY
jgi:ribonuclease HII